MKKMLAILLCFMMTMSLMACGQKEPPVTVVPEPNPAPVTPAPVTPETGVVIAKPVTDLWLDDSEKSGLTEITCVKNVKFIAEQNEIDSATDAMTWLFQMLSLMSEETTEADFNKAMDTPMVIYDNQGFTLLRATKYMSYVGTLDHVVDLSNLTNEQLTELLNSAANLGGTDLGIDDLEDIEADATSTSDYGVTVQLLTAENNADTSTPNDVAPETNDDLVLISPAPDANTDTDADTDAASDDMLVTEVVAKDDNKVIFKVTYETSDYDFNAEVHKFTGYGTIVTKDGVSAVGMIIVDIDNNGMDDFVSKFIRSIDIDINNPGATDDELIELNKNFGGMLDAFAGLEEDTSAGDSTS